jgi:uncharacterized protein (TIGR04255 family)
LVARRSAIPIKIPNVELGHLPKAPLRWAIAQVRFAPVLAVEDPAVVARFEASLSDAYAAMEPLKAEGVAGGPAGETIWLFRDPERQWTVSLTRASLALEAVTYLDFDHFAGELATVLRNFDKVFEPRTEVRLGVRYVNRIEDDRLEKRGIEFFINEKLAGPVGGELGSDLVGSRCELRFRERSGHVAIHHGLIEPSTYLLDFDHFSEGERDFVPRTIVERVKRFHGLIERLFVWSISDRYLKELQGARR